MLLELHITCMMHLQHFSESRKKKSPSFPISFFSIYSFPTFSTMQRIQRLIPTTHCFRRTPTSLWFHVNSTPPTTSTYTSTLRFYASGAAKGSNNSKKSSPFKYSHPESKSKNAVLSPSSLTTGATSSAPAATVAARESVSKIRRTAGSTTNFSRTLAEMCAKQYVPITFNLSRLLCCYYRNKDRGAGFNAKDHRGLNWRYPSSTCYRFSQRNTVYYL